MGFFLSEEQKKVDITNELIYRYFGNEIFSIYGYYDVQKLKNDLPAHWLKYKARALKIEEYELYRLRVAMSEMEVRQFINSL